jgi:pimeloyl-ACP methyl ester carboxylesterase
MNRTPFKTLSVVLRGLILGLGLLLGGNFAAAQVPVVQAVFPAADSEVAIKQWQLLGPFRFEQKDIEAPDAETRLVGLNHDYLADFGQNEASVDAAAFASLKTPKEGVALHKQFVNELIVGNPKTNILELATANRPFDYGIAYLAVIVESPEDQDVVIAAGADDNLKLWLNHEQLMSDHLVVHRAIRKFSKLAGVRLKKGSNFLLVKAGNLTGDWRVIVTLYPRFRALELAGGNAINPILEASVVSAGEPLVLRGDLIPTSKDTHAEVTDSKHGVVDSWKPDAGRKITRSLEKLEKDRVYYCRITAAGQPIEKPFYYGDLETGYQSLFEQAQPFEAKDEQVAIDLQAQLARLKHLLKPENRTSDAWDQKVAASFAELESNFAALTQGVETFLRAPGTHLRGYRSSVDNQILNYWIHVPDGLQRTGAAIPLVIVLPWTALTNLPFLESYQIASFEEAERYRILGDAYGFAVLQVWGRGSNLGGTAIWNADVFEALDAVREDYPIDSARIFLVGDCEGGRQALLLGERYPQRFAAIAVEGPITMIRNRSPYFGPWIQFASPISEVGTLLNTPVFISHEEQGNPPAQDSALFSSLGQKAGVDITFVRTEGGQHGFSQDPMGVKRSLFEFFRGKRHTPSPNGVPVNSLLQRFGVGHGPIEDAFGRSVLIVEGTQGTPAQHEVVHDLVQELLAEWRNAYFVDCPSKRDTEVSASDIENSNLILVGDSGTNSIIHRISDGLPLLATGSHISLGGKEFEGHVLGYEFIAPNPLRQGRYVVVIGMNQWTAMKHWRLHPSRDGICDFFVYDLEGSSPRLTGAGYFDGTFWQPSSLAVDHAGSERAN